MKKLISILLIAILNLTFVICHLTFAVNYTLASGDQLEIRIIGHSVFDTKQSISPDGTISLPAVGRIQAQGLTLKQLDNSLASEFSKYIEKPNIVVYLTQQPDWWEKNWYKVLTGTAVAVGIYSMLNR